MANDNSELENYLKGLPAKMRRELSAAVKAQAERLSAAQKQALQSFEQPPDDSGALEASCRVESKGEMEFEVVAGGESTTVDGYDYAVGFALGTQRQPARDFFYGPYRVLQKSMVSEIQKATEKALK